jgi:hypothetical protein
MRKLQGFEFFRDPVSGRCRVERVLLWENAGFLAATSLNSRYGEI